MTIEEAKELLFQMQNDTRNTPINEGNPCAITQRCARMIALIDVQIMLQTGKKPEYVPRKV